MKEYPKIEEFQKMMSTDQEPGRLMEIIFSLAGLRNTDDLTDVVKGAQPLGSWSGWSWW